ncbi:MAG: hypothetical protein JXA68_03030 [Ignavibacteriales bacterium]|nr:hypothetical protein [Ignavibacteriales bacterium]
MHRNIKNLLKSIFPKKNIRDNNSKSNINKYSETDIVIGFDFGTSCTKIVLQSPFAFNRRSILIPFNDYAHSSNKYLIPSVLYCDNNNVFSLVNNTGACVINNIKVDITNDDISKISEIIKINFVAYVSLVLRYVIKWFSETQTEIFSNKKIHWRLNFGIPSKGFNDESLKELIHHLLYLSSYISIQNTEINYNDIEKILKNPEIKLDDNYIHKDDITIIPEIAAEVVGYARSKLRDPGLHLIVDVGATTLDVSGFILSETLESKDLYSLLICEVKKNGANELHILRKSKVKNALEELLKSKVDKNDRIEPVPENIDSYIPNVNELKNIIRNNFNEPLYKNSFDLIRRVIYDLKNKRDPNSHRWNTFLPVFLLGGGCNHPVYKKLLQDINEWMIEKLQRLNGNGIKIKEIPIPENLIIDEDTKKYYHRFAVAYGLSFPPEDIGNIRPQNAIEDMTDIPNEIEEFEYIGQEMV